MNFLDCIEINPKVNLEKGTYYPFIEMGNVSTNYRSPIAIDYKPFDSGVKFKDGDTVIARITPCLQNGKRFYCNNIGVGFGSTEYLVFRPRNDSVDNLFLYYYMKTDFIKQSMIKSMTGATGRQRVNNEVFKSITVDFPNINSQRKIGHILATYDDLIETNQQQIKLLEETAHLLYNEWFVDFHYPGYESDAVINGIPDGWIPCKLSEVIEFNPKVILSKTRVKQCIPMSALSTVSMVLDSNEFLSTESNSGSKFQNGDTLLARITPCLENGKTAFVFGVDSPEGAVGSTEFIVMRSKRLNPYMVYLIARTDDFRKTAINSMTGSDGRQRAQVDKISLYEYVLPPDRIIESFEKEVRPIFDEIYTKHQQNIGLAEARDRLLPKLMNGEIKI